MIRPVQPVQIYIGHEVSDDMERILVGHEGVALGYIFDVLGLVSLVVVIETLFIIIFLNQACRAMVLGLLISDAILL